MISEQVKIQLKEYLKTNYTEDVLKILANKQITNRDGSDYSSSMVKNVLNGFQENIEIEKALTIVYHRRRKTYNQHQNKLKQVLEN